MEKQKLRLIELCSGIGSQKRGLDNTGIFETKIVATADLDKEVVVSYAAIHCGLTPEMIDTYPDYPSKEQMVEDLSSKNLGYDFKKEKPYDWVRLSKRKDKLKGIEKYWLADKISHNLGDVTKINSLPDCDLLTYSFPCTDISIAGEREGLMWKCKDCGYEYNPADYKVSERYICPHCQSHSIKSTRSGLLYEVERLLVERERERERLPKYLLMENVDALVSKKYIDNFNDWLGRLDNLGYNSYHQVINAKDTGIPQNRSRVFVMSIRKDIDMCKFQYPQPFDCGIRLINFLEDKVDDKFLISDKVKKRFKLTDETYSKNIVGTVKAREDSIGQRSSIYNKNKIIGTLTATDYKEPKYVLEKIFHNDNRLIQSGELCSEKYLKTNEITRRIYNEYGLIPSLHTCGGGNTEAKVERNNFLEIRKLTPKEYHRLMGFNDEDFYNCKAVGMSDSQGYKQAGNSIVTNCIQLIGEHLYKAQYDNNFVCTDEKYLKENFQ